MEIILKYFTDFTPRQLEQFTALERLYKEWNSKINVISRKDMDGLYEKHVLHSLSIAAIFDFEPGSEIIDIGTGGGFPGIPLAIFFPEVKFHLVDSIAKKIKVVKAIADETGLTNVSAISARVEEVKGKFDFAVTRAVASLKELWRWSRPLLKKAHPGRQHQVYNSRRSSYPPGLISLKGGKLGNEIQESGLRPHMMEITHIFPEEFFKEKFILYVQNLPGIPQK